MSEPIPPFSIFSAISELFVTAAVLYIIWRNWNRKLFPFLMFLAVVLFEAFVNVMYMAGRASAAATTHAHEISTGMKIFFAVHGIVSLVVFIGFILLGIFAYQDQRRGRFFFREHPVLTWIFLVTWVFSVGTGEAIFVMRYLL